MGGVQGMTAVLEAIGMEKRFPVKQQMLLRRRDTFQALQGIDLALYSGQTLGVVGESGSGKSTLGEIFGDLQQPTSGIVRYKGQDIRSLGEKEYRRFRRNVQYIFQNPKESMNPYYTVERILVEPMKILVDGFKPHKARETVREMLNRVGLPDSTLGKYPSELSGGQCQRIAIARALLLSPEVIICDECVSALDVSIQAQILNLLKQLQRDMGLTYVFITHDLSVVKYFSDDIAVMYLGQMVEKAPSDEIFANPAHPYTQSLLSAIPLPIVGKDKPERKLIKGEVTSPVNLPDQCRFMKRCDACMEDCPNRANPQLTEISPNHFVACHMVADKYAK